jgi:UDP-N-acetylmuramoyl-L-alanyl-D-glutamate--2,6-diaminopimelate ligase
MDDGTGKIASPYRQSTPESYILFPFLALCKKHGLDVVILEATSHALSNEGARLADIVFKGAVITPITSEHLEFHGTRERYIDAKMNLVRQLCPGGWVVFAPDAHLKSCINQVADGSIKRYEATWECHVQRVTLTSRKIELVYNKKPYAVTLPYGQSCYEQNFLCAISAVTCITGTFPDNIPNLQPIPGRFEVVPSQGPWTIIIDFAHTARAFTLLFAHVRSMISKGRIIALFGAAGERDRSKRYPMGYAAGSACDIIILTDEDPRGESPEQIADDLERGIRDAHFSGSLMRIADRKTAIHTAVDLCQEDDVLLLLAKGHETSIAYHDHIVAWNEREIVLEVVQHAI